MRAGPSAGASTTDALRGFATQGALRLYKDEVESGIADGGGVGNATGTGGESGFSATRTSDRAISF